MSVIIKGGGNNVLTDVDSMGNLMVTTEGQKATYRSFLTSTLATTGTLGIVATIFGSATKLVKITHISLSFIFTTAQIVNPGIIRYSTLPTGGTSTSQSPAQMDTTDTAFTATALKMYSAAPTEGTRQGLISGHYVTAGSASINPVQADFPFVGPGVKPLTLRGTSDGIGIFVNSPGAAGGAIAGFIEWTEE